MLGPNKVGDFVRDEGLVAEDHLGGQRQPVRVVVRQVLEGCLDSRIQHFLPGLEPPSKIKVNRVICKLIKLQTCENSTCRPATLIKLRLGGVYLFIRFQRASKYLVNWYYDN